MTLILKLSEELEQRLEAQAEQKHLSVNEYAVQLLEQNSVLTQRRNQAIDFFQSLRESAEEEEEGNAKKKLAKMIKKLLKKGSEEVSAETLLERLKDKETNNDETEGEEEP